MRLREELEYNRNFNDVVTIEECHFRAKVNALCATPTIVEASRKLGVSQPHVNEFLKDNNISKEELEMMREDYKHNNWQHGMARRNRQESQRADRVL